ncbi:hypothetical protein BH11MYX2_BH11MYX2_21280 [soil metagenome]
MWKGRVAGVGLASLLGAGVALAQPGAPTPVPAGEPSEPPPAGEPSSGLPPAPSPEPAPTFAPPSPAMPDHGFAPPSDELPPPPPPLAYPRAYTDRPLLLPNGGVEGALGLRIDTLKFGSDRYTTGGLRPSVRVGLGAAEIEAGASIFLFQDVPDTGGSTPTDPDRLQSVYGIARFTVAPETVIAGQLIASTPTNSQVKTFTPGAFIEHKEHLSQVSSLRLTGGFNYVHPSYDDDTTPSQDAVDVYAKVRGALQIAPLVALEGAAEYHFVKYTGDMAYIDQYTSNVFSLGIVGSVAPDIDVFAAFELNGTELDSGSFDGKGFVVGLSGRRIP